MIAVPVDAWRVNEKSEPLEELEGGERESGGAARCRTRKAIDDALASGGTVPGSLQPLEGQGRTGHPPPVGTVTQESFEPRTVVGRDVDRGIDAEPPRALGQVTIRHTSRYTF